MTRLRKFGADPASPVEERALEWFVRMRSDNITLGVQQEFWEWLAADLAHEREYCAWQDLWATLSTCRNAPELAAMREAALADRGEPVARNHRRGFRIAAALAVVAVVALVMPRLMPLQHAEYRTDASDRRTLLLADDSEITLDTDTAVRVEYTLLTRRVVLERGQAHFKVSHAILRPFEVEAGTGAVRAVGTAFDVYRHDDDVEVTLLQGRVEVAMLSSKPTLGASGGAPHVELKPGQRVVLTSKGMSAVQTVDLRKASAWLSGRLVLDEERLGDVVRELNRHSSMKIVVADAALSNVRISGVFGAGRSETFVDALKFSYPIRARYEGGYLVLKPTKPLPWPARKHVMPQLAKNSMATPAVPGGGSTEPRD